MAGLGLALNDRRRKRRAAGVASVLLSVDADGWQANYNGTPPSTTLNEPLSMTALGFNSTGGTMNRTINTGFRTTRRLRVAGSTSLQASKVGLSLKVPVGATISGVTNNSTQLVPKPIANWAIRSRQLIGNQDKVLEVVVGHYFGGIVAGEQAACVEFVISSSGGGSPITKRTSTMVLSSDPVDKKPVYVYRVTVTAAEMATLGNGRIAYNCNVYPFIGADNADPLLTSIARTTDAAARGFPDWKFSEIYDIKDPKRLSDGYRCYVDTATGNDTTGVWGTAAQDGAGGASDPAANPFATINGALTAAKLAAIAAGDTLAAGTVDGCQIRGRAGTHNLVTNTPDVPNAGAHIILTRDPGASPSAVIFSPTAANWNLKIGANGLGLLANCTPTIEFRDATYFRTASHNSNPPANTWVWFVNMTYDAAVNIGFGVTSTRVAHWGTSFINCVLNGNVALTAGGTGSGSPLRRGCSGNLNGCQAQGYNLIGCSFTNVAALTQVVASFSQDNTTMCFNSLSCNTASAVTPLALATDGTLYATTTGLLIMGNVFEWTINSAAAPLWRVSGDSNNGSTVHVLEYNNSYAGWLDKGRHNDRYVDTDATGLRTHQWGRRVNNITTQYNTKHDLFTPANAIRIGGWEVCFGVGNSANFHQFVDAAGGNPNNNATAFSPDYMDPQSQFQTVPATQLNPRYKNPQATNGSSNGAGGGDYRPQRISEGDAFDSPCLTMAEWTMLPGFGTVIGAWP